MTNQAAQYPEPEYLAMIGRIIYGVGYIEGLVLFDLPSMSDLPDGLSVEALSPLPTGAMRKEIETLLGQVTDPDDAEWFAEVVTALSLAALARNQLHARPATTVDGKQRLFRSKGADHFWIDDDWLTRANSNLDQAIALAGRLRRSERRK